MIEAIWFFAGLIFLFVGAEGLVRSASLLAKMCGVSSLVVGLTVVAYGTSSPELFVSCYGAYTGNVDIALGNVIGSNIFNILFILGMSALITPLLVHKQLIRFEMKIMLGVSFLLWLIGWYGPITCAIGLLFLMGVILYAIWLVRLSKKENDQSIVPIKDPPSWKTFLIQLIWIGAYLLILIIGSDLLVKGSVQIAKLLGVNELVIGLTVVAAGTSLPEAATSIVAALRKESDIAVGNVIGSNIFNILGVLGAAALFSPDGLPIPSTVLAFDIPFIVIISLACYPIFLSGRKITRCEGAIFLACYTAYLYYLIRK